MPGRPARLQLQALPCTLSPEEATRSLAEATKLLLAIDARRRAHQRSAPTSCGQDSNAAGVKAAA